MLPVLFVPALFVCAVVLAGYVKTRRAVRIFRSVADSPDRMLRRLLGASMVPGLVAAIWLSVHGLPPPIGVAIGALLMMGVLIASSGVLGVEGGLVEPGSEAAVRVALGQPPKTSALGRVIALTLGLELTGGATVLSWWASQI
ncbi:MAG TPA: hypothetical protein VM925_33210 [Labilithrix sp.]|nr:hypothetical protein [Labilithrix sp.]